MTHHDAAYHTKDEHFDLVSAVYHCLEGAEAASTYRDDAQKEGDKDVSDYFEEVRKRNLEMAEWGKKLLAARIQ
jgi:hypothetical protein